MKVIGDRMRIIKDFRAFTEDGGGAKKIATLLINPCFHSVCLYRLSNLFYHMHLSILSKIIWYLNRMLFHVDIDYRANLAGGFVFVHGLGTVIGKDVTSLGKLRVYQGVTLGGNQGKSAMIPQYDIIISQPLFEEDVIIFTGASIFGPVLIHKNEIVKAGTMITCNSKERESDE